MSFMDHLLELRARLIVCVSCIALTTVLSFIFFDRIHTFLRAPVDQVNEKFRADEEFSKLVVENLRLSPGADVVQPITTNPLGLLVILMKVALYAGLVLASPVVLYELWRFVAPALKAHEARVVRPVLVVGILFFVAGALFCYYAVFPFTIEFVVWLDVYLGYRPSYTPEEYIGLLVTFMMIFGATFEVPLVAGVLARLGVLKPEWLTRYWRYVVLASFFLGALASPGTDIMSMLIMSGTLVILYLLSVILAWFLYPRPT